MDPKGSLARDVLAAAKQHDPQQYLRPIQRLLNGHDRDVTLGDEYPSEGDDGYFRHGGGFYARKRDRRATQLSNAETLPPDLALPGPNNDLAVREGRVKGTSRVGRVEGTADEWGWAMLQPDRFSNGGRRRRVLSSGFDTYEGARPHTHRSEVFTELSPEGATIAGHLAEGGWHIEKAGSTGRPVGRPRRGIYGPDFIKACFPAGLLDAVGEAFASEKRLTGDLRDEFARVLATDAARVNAAALAKYLGCARSTITRSRKHGAGLVHLNTPKRGEDKMAVADAELAVDAERLAEIAEDVFRIAARLQARFPSSQMLGATVERFIEAALNNETLKRAA